MQAKAFPGTAPALARGLARRLAGGWLLAGAVLCSAAAQERRPLPPPPPPPVLTEFAFAALPGWAEDAPAAALAPFLASCGAWGGMPAERPLGAAGPIADLGITPSSWRRVCSEAQALSRDLAREPVREPAAPCPSRCVRPAPGAAERAAQERQRVVRGFFERSLVPYSVGRGLITGYYEPVLRGSQQPRADFPVPLLAPPPLPRERALDRASIETGALQGRGLEIVWIDDPVEVYFLQIQGSGRVVLPDGRLLRVGYAGQNGMPFRSVWRAMQQQGVLGRGDGSMQAVRAALARAEPGLVGTLLRDNPSYVYFRVVEGLRPDQGPVGALGVPLTPERSLAVDFSQVPMGAPVFIAPRHPETGRPVPRLMLAQDQGGAIRGPARGDFFWGWGADAAAQAGRMYDTTEMFVLLPRPPLVAQAGGARPGG